MPTILNSRLRQSRAQLTSTKARSICGPQGRVGRPCRCFMSAADLQHAGSDCLTNRLIAVPESRRHPRTLTDAHTAPSSAGASSVPPKVALARYVSSPGWPTADCSNTAIPREPRYDERPSLSEHHLVTAHGRRELLGRRGPSDVGQGRVQARTTERCFSCSEALGIRDLGSLVAVLSTARSEQHPS
jgi:hypothetical protein